MNLVKDPFFDGVTEGVNVGVCVGLGVGLGVTANSGHVTLYKYVWKLSNSGANTLIVSTVGDV